MNGIFVLLGAYLLISLVQGGQELSSTRLDNLTDVVDLNAKNFDEKIANKHHFVLFYAARYVLNMY